MSEEKDLELVEKGSSDLTDVVFEGEVAADDDLIYHSLV